MLKTTATLALIISSLISSTTNATNTTKSSVLERTNPLAHVDTLKLCLDYHNLTQDDSRNQYKKELDYRAQLSTKDHQLIDQNQVENSMTRCGMYMALGSPLREQSRQIRPMTFKTVHVYPDKYYVSQSGMIVETLDRKTDTLPPQLIPIAPKIVPPPVTPKH